MKTVTLRDLHLATGRWVREAASGEPLIITDRGRPLATLLPYDTAPDGRPLPDRETRIRARSRVPVDSTAYLSEMRERP